MGQTAAYINPGSSGQAALPSPAPALPAHLWQRAALGAPEGSRLSLLARLPCAGALASFLSRPTGHLPQETAQQRGLPLVRKQKACLAWVDAGREEREDGVLEGDYMLKV